MNNEIIYVSRVIALKKKNLYEVTLKVRHGYFIRRLDKSESGIVPGSF